MRASEWIQIVFAFGIGLLAWMRPLEMRRRLRIAVLAIIVPAAILIARFALHGFAGSVVRDWLPAALLLIPYWQAGQFFTGPDERIQKWLTQTDEKVLRVLRRIIGSSENGGWARYFETAYLMCYPLRANRTGRSVSWASPCSGRLLLDCRRAGERHLLCHHDFCSSHAASFGSGGLRNSQSLRMSVRKLNLEVLNRGSIQAITFPSAHVASTTAVALVLTRFLPLTGAIFLMIAASIAIGAFLGRYHYFLDVALGAIEAAVVFLVCLLVFRR